MGKLEKLLELNGIRSNRRQTPETVEISREDFDLLDVEQEVIYHIFEEDGTVTVRKGENK